MKIKDIIKKYEEKLKEEEELLNNSNSLSDPAYYEASLGRKKLITSFLIDLRGSTMEERHSEVCQKRYTINQ